MESGYVSSFCTLFKAIGRVSNLVLAKSVCRHCVGKLCVDLQPCWVSGRRMLPRNLLGGVGCVVILVKCPGGQILYPSLCKLLERAKKTIPLESGFILVQLVCSLKTGDENPFFQRILNQINTFSYFPINNYLPSWDSSRQFSAYQSNCPELSWLDQTINSSCLTFNKIVTNPGH